MIWTFLFISFGVISAREYVEPEYLDELMKTGQHEKFAELLGIQKHLVRPNDTEERSEGSIFNQASFLGDILLTEEQERNAIDFNRYPESKWPGGIIPFVISRSYSVPQRMIIIQGITDFNSRITNVKLVPRIMQEDYVFIFSGNGCFSPFGKSGGQQGMSLQENGCLSIRTIQHEFIHAVGFAHEHNRLDRDSHVQVLFDNIPFIYQSEYQKVDENTFKDIGDYDYYSIMHYPILAPGTDNDAFLLPDGIDRNSLGKGKNGRVTDGDIYKVNTLYA